MTAYEDVLYDDFPWVTAHPALLGAFGALHGLPAPDLDSVRVLDLGCALGGHLIPLAELHPGGTYVGLDLSEAQIAAGRATAEALGQSVDLRVADLATVDPDSLGRFDVIVCHGVYAWVPPQVQQAIWRVIRRCLAPTGIAFVSTNVQPGWQVRGTLRAVLRRTDDPSRPDRERVARARQTLEAWRAAVEARPGGVSAALREEIAHLDAVSDAYVLYEHLAEVNTPVWFDDLAAEATDAGLAYLGDAVPAANTPDLPEATRAWIDARSGGDRIRHEALIDAVTHRMFRRSLWVHRETFVDHELIGRRLEGLSLASPLTPSGAVPLDGTPVRFATPAGETLDVDDALVQAALLVLAGASPGGLAFTEVCASAAALLGTPATGAERARLGRALLQAWSAGLLEVRTAYPPIARHPGPRPRTTALARLQARRGDDGCVNLLHRRMALGHTERAVLARLDGAHDRAALRRALADDIAQGTVEVTHAGRPTTEPAVLDRVLDTVLDRLAGAAFLLDPGAATP